ncbi:hypothetical protein BC830DRAFT_1232403 [Chytriomyces sp. MP71]|nr:hypothetical protein BC830DRAFT_1232403 [Chytriomyces sp. MP71]
MRTFGVRSLPFSTTIPSRPSPLGPVVTLTQHTQSCFFLDTTLPDQMLAARAQSNLSGPLARQNPRAAYIPHTANHHTTAAWRDGRMVGYILAKTFATERILFGTTKHYAAPDAAQTVAIGGLDTLIVNEIVVIRGEQGHGLAGRMLDFLMRQDGMRDVREVEFTVLAENHASESMFTRFAERHGDSISFGSVANSDWGNYVDWTVAVSDPKRKALQRGEEEGRRGSGGVGKRVGGRILMAAVMNPVAVAARLLPLQILSPLLETVALLARGDWASYWDRDALIQRSRLYQNRGGE